MSSIITLEEQEKILMHAIGLIREPENFTTGKWKCPVVQNGQHVTDDNDRPQFSYCVEGAINQATYDILGEERALSLGAGQKDGDYFDPTTNYTNRRKGPTELMQLNKLAYQMYAKEMGWTSPEGDRYALGYNDGRGNHEGILNLLRGRLGQVRKRLNSKKKIAA